MARRASRPPHQRSIANTGRGSLRLIGGQFRRRRLPIPDRPGLRPTPDRVRETLFNWLTPMIAGARVLDLYAGTGALGMEALSRGAGYACFVERDNVAARQLRHNLSTLFDTARENEQFRPGFEVIEADVLSMLTDAPTPPFELILLDPPFRQGLCAASCERLMRGGWLSHEAWIYVESEADGDFTPPMGWTLHRHTRAGDSLARLYRYSRDTDTPP